MLVLPRAILIWVAWAARQGHSDIRTQIAAKTMSGTWWMSMAPISIKGDVLAQGLGPHLGP